MLQDPRPLEVYTADFLIDNTQLCCLGKDANFRSNGSERHVFCICTASNKTLIRSYFLIFNT